MLSQRGHRSDWILHTSTAAWLRCPPGGRCPVGAAGVSPEVPSVSGVCLHTSGGNRCSQVRHCVTHRSHRREMMIEDFFFVKPSLGAYCITSNGGLACAETRSRRCTCLCFGRTTGGVRHCRWRFCRRMWCQIE